MRIPGKNLREAVNVAISNGSVQDGINVLIANGFTKEDARDYLFADDAIEIGESAVVPALKWKSDEVAPTVVKPSFLQRLFGKQ